MLQKVKDGEEIDKSKISNFFLKNNLITYNKAEPNILQYSNGYSNLTYLITFNDNNFVLRCPPKGAVKRGHDMSRGARTCRRTTRGHDRVPPREDKGHAEGQTQRG